MFILKHVKTRMCPNTLTQDIDTPFVQGEQFKNTMWLSTGICKIFITHLFPGPSFKIEKNVYNGYLLYMQKYKHQSYIHFCSLAFVF